MNTIDMETDDLLALSGTELTERMAIRLSEVHCPFDYRTVKGVMRLHLLDWSLCPGKFEVLFEPNTGLLCAEWVPHELAGPPAYN